MVVGGKDWGGGCVGLLYRHVMKHVRILSVNLKCGCGEDLGVVNMWVW